MLKLKKDVEESKIKELGFLKDAVPNDIIKWSKSISLGSATVYILIDVDGFVSFESKECNPGQESYIGELAYDTIYEATNQGIFERVYNENIDPLLKINEEPLVKTYRKKPIEIQALHYTKNTKISELEEFVGTSLLEKYHYDNGEPILDKIQIRTLNGLVDLSIGNYIIKGLDNECYPCDEKIFNESYEEL